MNVGFTGTKLGMTPKQHKSMVGLLGFLKNNYQEFHHGDCEGSDIQAAKIANWYNFEIHCHPPVNDTKRGFFKFNRVIYPAYDYIVRDRHIVEDSHIMIAIPHESYEINRSGTWTTVRYAREIGRPIYIIKPDGTIELEIKS